MAAKSESTFYRCKQCNLYFESYSKATVHLGHTHTHSTDLLNKTNQKKKRGRPRRNGNRKSNGIVKDKHNLIETQEFPQVSILIDKLTTNEINKFAEKSFKTQQTPMKSTSKKKTRKNIGSRRLEIKLDTFKASEIELLIQNLCNTNEASSSKGSNYVVKPRKSTRKVKPRVPKSYGELDSEDEEIIRIGSGSSGKVKRLQSKEKDLDYDYATDKNDSTRSSFKKSNVTIREIQSDLNENPSETRGQGKKRRARFKCKICNIRFSSGYMRHMQEKHFKNNKYTCPCDKDFTNLGQFNRHLTAIHSSYSFMLHGVKKYRIERKLKCEICNRKFSIPEKLIKHKATHERKHHQMPFKCPICEKGFKHEQNIKRHLILHLENNPFVCKFSGCGKKFNCESNLQRHVTDIHTEDRAMSKCELCPAVYTRKQHLQRHFNARHSENSNPKYKLSLKRMYYYKQGAGKNSNNLETIIKEEEKSNDLRLEVDSVHLVDRIIRTDDDQHSIHVKGETLSPQKSPNQSRSVSPTPSLEEDEHEAQQNKHSSDNDIAHTDLDKLMSNDPKIKALLLEKPDLIKPILKLNYGGKCNRLAYSRTQQVRRYKCHLCPWSTSHTYFFQNHLEKVHGQTVPAFPSTITTTESPSSKDHSSSSGSISLICGSCGYHSNSSEDLASHMSSSHTGANKFHCSFCGRRFPTESRKAKHEKVVHLTEKKYGCDQCSAKYAAKLSLYTHKKNKHDPKYQNIKCSICNRILKNKLTYDIHMRLHSVNRPSVTCKMCGQRCADIYCLRRHIQYVHLKVKNPYNMKQKLSRKNQSKSLLASENNNLETEGNQSKHTTIETHPENCVQESNAIVGF